MHIVTTTLEEAQALGFNSVDEMQSHADWIQARQAEAQSIRDYQGTAEAAERRAQAGVPADTIVMPAGLQGVLP